ncbi:hypothetical protein BGZ54_006491 [Gamsiella multidivaricata]|nr:hypothetical protein BGZ54_006491 [Gamsiella multidivaricata]
MKARVTPCPSVDALAGPGSPEDCPPACASALISCNSINSARSIASAPDLSIHQSQSSSPEQLPSTSQLLEHPHIIFPSMHQSDDIIAPKQSTAASESSIALPSISTFELIDGDKSAKAPFMQGSSRSWGLKHDRSLHRESTATDQDSDDAGQESSTESEESSDSEVERRLALEPHKPISMKRRKASEEDEDENEDEDQNEDLMQRQASGRLSPSDTSSPPRRQSQQPVESSSTPPSPSRASPHRPSSWPARKRRSILADPSPKFSVPCQTDPPSCSNLDTSSLSLLSATSALVSAGTIPPLDSKDGFLPPLLSPPASTSSSPSSSPTSSPTEPQFASILGSFACAKASNATKTRRSSSFCRRLRYCFPLLGACRKRNFEEAIELTRPLGNDPSVEHAGWLSSIKRRKIHHYPTRWTSTLSPSPYVKLMAMRDFWDVMQSRLDLSWLDLLTITTSTCQEFQVETEQTDIITDCKGTVDDVKKGTGATLREESTDIDTGMKAKEVKSSDEVWSLCLKTRRRTVVQHPNAGLFLRGLWEEEERSRRQRQMVPESVHKTMRSKVLNRKPLPRSNVPRSQPVSWIIPKDTKDLKDSSASSSSYVKTSDQATEKSKNDEDTKEKRKSDAKSSQQNQAEQEMILRKKPGPAAAVRSNALSEGYDLNEHKPWRDATITPHRGSIRSLCKMRSTMLEPWPSEKSRAKDECTRVLHRMREQLNVVINLQIHLRSMIKTTPSHMSFLLSIRHPGQVSVELLNALYGPQFMQTSAFRSIEQLLWGKHQPARIEHQYHHQYHHSQHQNPGYLPHSSHAPDYRYHDHENQRSFESKLDSGVQDQHGQPAHYHRYHHQGGRRHDHHHHDGMEDNEGCEFEEEFDEQSYQDPMMGLDHIVEIGDHGANRCHSDMEVEAKAWIREMVSEDDEIEALGVSRAPRDGILVEVHQG